MNREIRDYNTTVSVIITAYNTAKYIRKAISSVLMQSESSIELIIVDDASTDNTVTIVDEFNDSRITLLRNTDNRGPSYSRNRALKIARGKWIAILDSDDWFAPERLKILLQIADEENADLVADDLYMIREGEKVPFKRQFHSVNYILPRRFTVDPIGFIKTNKEGLKCLRLGVTKPLFRRDFLESHGLTYNSSIRFCEDFWLVLQCLLCGAHFVLLNQPFYYRLRRTGAITTGNIVPLLRKARSVIGFYLASPQIQRNAAVVAALREFDQHHYRHLTFRQAQQLFVERKFGDLLHPPILTGAASYLMQRIIQAAQHNFFTSTEHPLIRPLTRKDADG